MESSDRFNAERGGRYAVNPPPAKAGGSASAACAAVPNSLRGSLRVVAGTSSALSGAMAEFSDDPL
jgi:hypothetical protein